VLAFGDWKKAVIGSYGSGIELLYDPYTLAAEGEIKVIASGLFDTGISNYRAFSWADDVSAGL
jgi:predicted phage gp36 major capsid-like protein